MALSDDNISDNISLCYLYHGNRNIHIFFKKIVFICILSIVISAMYFCVDVYFSSNPINIQIALFSLMIIILSFICVGLLSMFVMYIYNRYLQRKYLKIKEHGKKMEGEIVIALYDINKSGTYRWLSASRGCIGIEVNDNIYEIKDIEYNDNFRKLEKQLNSILEQNELLNYQNWLQRKKIQVTVYMFQQEIVADLDSIVVK